MAHSPTSDCMDPIRVVGPQDSLPCASGACCPEGTLRAPGLGWGVLLREALGWAPSCCGQSQGRDLG